MSAHCTHSHGFSPHRLLYTLRHSVSLHSMRACACVHDIHNARPISYLPLLQVQQQQQQQPLALTYTDKQRSSVPEPSFFAVYTAASQQSLSKAVIFFFRDLARSLEIDHIVGEALYANMHIINAVGKNVFCAITIGERVFYTFMHTYLLFIKLLRAQTHTHIYYMYIRFTFSHVFYTSGRLEEIFIRFSARICTHI